ncbi:MAG: hypothetical protein M0015_18180 [Betaproteobacteria bacterium]|nr:hypothetical protein [Betaproteobacteria bacterium]
MDEFDRLSRLVLQIQEAALTPARWSGVVDAIVCETGGSEGILFSPSIPPSLGGFWASRAIAPEHMEDYAAYYVQRDVWRMAGEARMREPGAVFPDAALLHTDAVRCSEFYCDFLRPLDIGRLLCGIVAGSNDRAIRGGLHLSVFKPMGGEGFGDAQRKLVERLMPHLQTAIATHYALGAQARAVAVGEAVLDALSAAALIVERDATVVFANEAARRIAAEGDGILIAKSALGAASPRAASLLRDFVAGLFPPENARARPRVLRIERPSGRKPYACFGQYLPVDGALACVAGRPAALLFIRDPGSGRVLEPEVLMQLFGFTTAEALLAGSLAGGKSLQEAARHRGIRYETARTQLKALFAKTGCTRQAELVALLAGSGSL